MTDPNRVPVVVGVAQLRNNRARVLEEAREPLDLLVDALRAAADDSGVGERLLHEADALRIVKIVSWAYDDLPGLVAQRLGTTFAASDHEALGGNSPCKLLDQAAARIARGETRVELLGGAEARSSLELVEATDGAAGWTTAPGGKVSIAAEEGRSEAMAAYGLNPPIRGYPLYENALRHSLGMTFEEGQRWSGELYASFTRVAADNPAAWNPEPLSADDIATVGPKNRMVCWPYPLRMNAFPKVDQAAAVIVTSLAAARELSVPEDRIVHVWGGAGAVDAFDLLDRPSFDRSPGMAAVLDTSLDRAGVTADELALIDLYSCFPVVPELGMIHLKLPQDSVPTVTGGLNAFGGPANNYSMHALVRAAELLRAGGVGLVYGNGIVVTKHHAIVLAKSSHPEGYVGTPDPVLPLPADRPAVVDQASGAATVETFTVEFDKTGEPAAGWVIGRTAEGGRFYSIVDPTDRATLDGLVDPTRDAIGRSGVVERHPTGRNVFALR